LRPARRYRVSSTTSRSAPSPSTSRAQISPSSRRPSWSGDQRAAAKNRCARLWCQRPASCAPASIPHTVRVPGWATNPATSQLKVVKVGAVKQPRKQASRSTSEGGRLHTGIGGLFPWRVGAADALWPARSGATPPARTDPPARYPVAPGPFTNPTRKCESRVLEPAAWCFQRCDS
jgi:hypothetical protein